MSFFEGELKFFHDFPKFVDLIVVFLLLFLVFSSTSLVKNTKIRALLVKFYVFLTQAFGCMPIAIQLAYCERNPTLNFKRIKDVKSSPSPLVHSEGADRLNQKSVEGYQWTPEDPLEVQSVQPTGVP